MGKLLRENHSVYSVTELEDVFAYCGDIAIEGKALQRLSAIESFVLNSLHGFRQHHRRKCPTACEGSTAYICQ